MDFQRGRVHLLIFIVGIIVLSIAAEKCRLLVGEESSSQSGKFTIFDCFDMKAQNQSRDMRAQSWLLRRTSSYES